MSRPLGDKPSVVTSFRLTQEELAQLRSIARILETNPSTLVRATVQALIKEFDRATGERARHKGSHEQDS